MSEAVNPNRDAESLQTGQPDPSDISSSEPVLPVAAAESEDDWQTVDFPGTIPIQELVQASYLINSASDATAISALPADSFSEEQMSTYSNPNPEGVESLQNLVHYLRRENSSLRGQVIQLEQDLAQVQVDLQLEVARFYCKESENQESVDAAIELAVNEADELVAARAQIQRLTQELKQSQVTVQQQQELVSTLTEQLEGGQERIAQLERDCALSQQRYIEQGQQLIQLENTCNDLRMRLHRQQQQTLQFKAALEKSLEMPSVISSDHIISSDTVIPFPTPETTEAQTFIPKAQPVQPWSKMADSSGGRSHAVQPRSQAKELPNLLKLVNPDTPDHSHPSDVLGAEEVAVDLTTPSAELLALENRAVAPETPVPLQVETPDLDALFPDVPPIAIVPDTAQEAIFDLSPFVEAGEVDPATIPPARSAVPPEAIAPAPSSPELEVTSTPPQENNLWADLARLIEPDMVTENAAIASDLTIEVESNLTEHVSSQQQIEVAEVNELIIQAAETTSSTEETDPVPQVLNPFGQSQSTFEAPWVAEMHPGSPFITVKSPAAARIAASDSFQEPAIPTVNSLESFLPESSPGLPSPVLKPFRPAKKIKSMASVELPSFPRTAQ